MFSKTHFYSCNITASPEGKWPNLANSKPILNGLNTITKMGQNNWGWSGKPGSFRNASFHRNTSSVTFELIGGVVCSVKWNYDSSLGERRKWHRGFEGSRLASISEIKCNLKRMWEAELFSRLRLDFRLDFVTISYQNKCIVIWYSFLKTDLKTVDVSEKMRQHISSHILTLHL